METGQVAPDADLTCDVCGAPATHSVLTREDETIYHCLEHHIGWFWGRN